MTIQWATLPTTTENCNAVKIMYFVKEIHTAYCIRGVAEVERASSLQGEGAFRGRALAFQSR